MAYYITNGVGLKNRRKRNTLWM